MPICNIQFYGLFVGNVGSQKLVTYLGGLYVNMHIYIYIYIYIYTYAGRQKLVKYVGGL